MRTVKIETIFDLMKNKEPRGFELLYENYFRMMYGVAYSITKDDGVSQDAIQNTMFKLYNLSEERYPQSGELTWLYKVVKNETLTVLRKETKDVELEKACNLYGEDLHIEHFVDMQNYYSLIESLNEKQKEVVNLKILGDLSHKEIAQVLDKPIGTIQWIYNTSIKKLRVALTTLSMGVVVTMGIAYKTLSEYRNNDSFGTTDVGVSTVIPAVTEYDVMLAGGLVILAVVLWISFFVSAEKIKLFQKRSV